MLTPREKEILVARERGLTNKQVAAQLGISAHTVKHHISRLLKKLGVESCAQALWKLKQRSAGAT